MKRKKKQENNQYHQVQPITTPPNGCEECIWQDDKGYWILRAITDDGQFKDMPMHYIMAQTFHPNPEGYEHVHFIDGDKNNYKANNLKWEKYPQAFN